MTKLYFMCYQHPVQKRVHKGFRVMTVRRGNQRGYIYACNEECLKGITERVEVIFAEPFEEQEPLTHGAPALLTATSEPALSKTAPARSVACSAPAPAKSRR